MSDAIPASRRRALPIALGAIVVLMLALTLALWARYGATVFFEIIRAGFAACFG